MRRLAILSLVILVVVGAGLAWLLRPPAPAPAPVVSWLATLDTERVASLTVAAGSPPGGDLVITRVPGSDAWVMKDGPGVPWPVPGERVRGTLRLLIDAARAEPAERGKAAATTIGLTLGMADGSTGKLSIDAGGLGGFTKMEVALSGGGTDARRVDARLASALAPEGVRSWKDDVVLGGPFTDPSRVRLDAGGAVLELTRRQGRWAVQLPLAAPADTGAVSQLVAKLTSLRVVRFLDASGVAPGAMDSPTSVVTLESDSRMQTATGVERRVLLQTLRVGPAADAIGATLTARVEAVWKDPATGATTPAWGPVLVALRQSDLAISPLPDPVLARTAWNTPGADVRGLRLSEPGVGDQAPRAVANLARTLDGWAVRGAAPLPADDAAQAAALVTLLSDTPAATVLLGPATPADAAASEPRALALVSITPTGEASAPEAEGVAISLGSVASPSGPVAALVVRSGRIRRAYPLAGREALVAWLRKMVPAEG